MDVSLNSITQRELACTEEDSSKNLKEITIDDVLKFIKEKGFLYSDKIEDALRESNEDDEADMISLMEERKDMYQRLSRL